MFSLRSNSSVISTDIFHGVSFHLRIISIFLLFSNPCKPVIQSSEKPVSNIHLTFLTLLTISFSGFEFTRDTIFRENWPLLFPSLSSYLFSFLSHPFFLHIIVDQRQSKRERKKASLWWSCCSIIRGSSRHTVDRLMTLYASQCVSRRSAFKICLELKQYQRDQIDNVEDNWLYIR